MTASESPVVLVDLLTCPCCNNPRFCYLGRSLSFAVTAELTASIIGSSGGDSPLVVSPEWEIPAGIPPVDTAGDGTFFGSELIDSLSDPIDDAVIVREQGVSIRGGFGENNRYKVVAQWDHTDGYNYIVTARLSGYWNVSPYFIAPDDPDIPQTIPQWSSGGQPMTPEARFDIQWYLARRLQSSHLAHAIYSNLGNPQIYRVESAFEVELERTPLEYAATWSDLSEWDDTTGSTIEYTAVSATIGVPIRQGICRPTDEI